MRDSAGLKPDFAALNATPDRPAPVEAYQRGRCAPTGNAGASSIDRLASSIDHLVLPLRRPGDRLRGVTALRRNARGVKTRWSCPTVNTWSSRKLTEVTLTACCGSKVAHTSSERPSTCLRGTKLVAYGQTSSRVTSEVDWICPGTREPFRRPRSRMYRRADCAADSARARFGRPNSYVPRVLVVGRDVALSVWQVAANEGLCRIC